MPTREQLERALINADAAGDSAAAKQIANALKEMQRSEPPTQQQAVTSGAQTRAEDAVAAADQPQPNMLQKFLAGGVKRGLETIGTGGRNVSEPVRAMASGMVAEPVAGLSGMAAAPFVGAEGAEDVIEGTREALTLQPETASGKRGMQSIGETLRPVGEALQYVEKGLGDFAFETTGSPAVAAGATTLPTLALEVLGFGAGRKLAPRRVPGAKAAKVSDKAAKKALIQSAPEVDEIKTASRALYKSLDDMQVSVKPEAYKSMLRRVVNKAKAENVDDVLTPKSSRVVQQFADELDTPGPKSLSRMDQIRKKAQIAAQSADPSDARVGAIMVDEIDDFMDSLNPSSFVGRDAASASKVAPQYRAARKLWGRARKSELISEAFDKAQRQASGFENGLRTQLRQILNNKKRSRFFTKDELAAMDDVVQGSGTQNVLKLVGRLGFSEGAATNVLGALASGYAINPSVPVIGQISRKLAQKSTLGAARRMESLVKGGADGPKIAKTYLAAVPKAKRSVQELSDWLLASGKELDDLLGSANKTIREAAELARGRSLMNQAEVAGTVAASVPQQAENE